MQIRLVGSRLVLPNLGALGDRCSEELATGGPFVAMRAAALSYSTKYAITRDDTDCALFRDRAAAYFVMPLSLWKAAARLSIVR